MNIHCKTIALATAMTGLLASTAFSEPNDGDFRSKQSGSWTSTSTWERYDAKNALSGGPGWLAASVVPSAGNLASIREGHLVQILGGSKSIATLIIEDSATVPGKLEIKSTGIGQSHQLTVGTAMHMEYALSNPGEVIFTDSGLAGSPARLIASGNIAVAGKLISQAAVRGGSIETSGSAVLTIGPSAELESPLGSLTLTGNFEMDGTVRANGPYTVTVTGTPRAGSSGNWEVITSSSATLRFNTASALTIDSSGGHILLAAGTLDIDQTFTFAGGG